MHLLKKTELKYLDSHTPGRFFLRPQEMLGHLIISIFNSQYFSSKAFEAEKMLRRSTSKLLAQAEITTITKNPLSKWNWL